PGGATGEHFSIPSGQAVSTNEPSIFALGVRNPFSAVLDEDGDLFFGDVGSSGAGAGGTGAFEEINCLYFAGENYGWPHCEGPCSPPNASFRDPTHGYLHSDTTFSDEDPLPNPTGGKEITGKAFYS